MFEKMQIFVMLGKLQDLPDTGKNSIQQTPATNVGTLVKVNH
jgi:hypothetical protein